MSKAFGAELGGVGVAEAVGVDALVDAGLAGEARKQASDVGAGHGTAGKRTEQRSASDRAGTHGRADATSGRRCVGAIRIDSMTRSHIEPPRDDLARARVDPDRSRPAALAAKHAHRAGSQVHILRP